MIGRVQLAAFAAAALVGSCGPQATTPDVTAAVGGVTDAAMTPREVVSRDIDRPPRLRCGPGEWRYHAPDPSKLPADFTDAADYEYTSLRTPRKLGSPAALCGQRGPALDLAWEVSHGRDDVLIAVLDSGIEWRSDAMDDLARQAYLNAAELPYPHGATTWDANGDGRFDVRDYDGDPRVGDRNGNGRLDPEDLILTPEFNDGVDDDGNGWVDDISGWDHLFDDNNPLDDVDYGHGTGEARDSTAADGNGGDVGGCPDCRFLPVRVGDSFITEGGRFAAGVLFSLDSGADVVQEALGAITNPPQAQLAIDAAYRRGVPIVASMADEASKHANFPAVLNRTIAVNSITRHVPAALSRVADVIGGDGDADYLALNGCTNYGAITWVSVPSTSCSSGAVGMGAGMVGLIESVARETDLSPHPVTFQGGAGDNRLSANEMAQLLRATADDVDFATPTPPVDPPNNRGVEGTRYPTTPGWDATFGFGRVNTFEAVRAVAAGEIPPEADMTAPSFLEVLGASGTLRVAGDIAAHRSSSYSYVVQWTTGLQGPPHPGADVWRTVASASGRTTPTSGDLATIDLATVAAALPDGGRGASLTDGRSDEDRFAVRVRVVVTDAEGRIGVAQRQVYVHDDPDLVTAQRVEGAGAASPVFANVDGVGADELVVATDDGTVHVLDVDGHDIAGWPRHTSVAAYWNPASRTAREDRIPPLRAPIGVGAPVTADLDGDGSIEIAHTDGNGELWVWGADGTPRAHASVDERWSAQSATNATNRLKPGFFASPAAGDLDGDGDLELVAAALDRHVYAWHHDGTPVDGFPVLVVDPARAAAVDPRTHAVTFSGDAGDTGDGGELIVTPALGDLTGDGRPEIVVGAQEQYTDERGSVWPEFLNISGLGANTRVYAIHPDGAAHVPAPGERTVDAAPAHPHDHAYLPGWPVRLQMIMGSVLPLIGNGVNVQAAIGDVDGDGGREVVVSSSAGPVMVLDADGRTPYDNPIGAQVTLDWIGEPFGSRANSRDGGVVVSAFGGPALGDLTGDGTPEVAAPTVGLAQAADQLLPGRQPGDTQLMAWNPRTRAPLAGFPHRTTDLGFFVTPAIADVDGDGFAEVVAGNGVHLLDAVNHRGVPAPGWPKLHGGWVVGTPAFGDHDGDGVAEVAVTRRDGWLMVWRTGAPTSSLVGWTRFGGDDRNSGSLP